MNENEINLDLTDRGDKTIAQLEADLPQAAIDIANETADRAKEKAHKEKRHFNRRNRVAWERMNRPEKLKRMEINMERILNFIDFNGYVRDSEVPKEAEVNEI